MSDAQTNTNRDRWSDESHDVVFRACVAAVHEHFSHLPVAALIDPPEHWFDAALARQIVIHLMVSRIGVSKRGVVALQRRSREAINRGLMVIDWRLDSPDFETAYRAMGERAETLLAGMERGMERVSCDAARSAA